MWCAGRGLTVRPVSRRAVLGAGAGAALATLTGCAQQGPASPGTGPQAGAPTSTAAAPATGAGPTPGAVSPTAPTGLPRLIGDGSTSDTGVQPRQPTVSRLVPGQAPPQFVICSWDGAGETASRLFSHFRGVAEELSASMTFFLTGLYAVPAGRRSVYQPPRHPVGASDIGFLPERSVHATIDQVGRAWLEGHEIGTHFNGHFCGPGGVDLWSPEEWDTEIEQAISFVKTWRTTTGFTDLPPLPFDYDAELIGGRTPCLQGQANLLRAGGATTWRYDSSGTGRQVWPTRFPGGRWNLPMQAIPFPGHDFEVISMDYNMMYNQSKTPDGDPAARGVWRGQARDAYLAGFRRAYHGNRAPLVIGNHFERWNGGIYMEAVEAAIREMAAHPDVRFVSFHQLVDWLEAQDPSVLRGLQSLDVGRPPRGGWD